MLTCRSLSKCWSSPSSSHCHQHYRHGGMLELEPSTLAFYLSWVTRRNRWRGNPNHHSLNRLINLEHYRNKYQIPKNHQSTSCSSVFPVLLALKPRQVTHLLLGVGLIQDPRHASTTPPEGALDPRGSTASDKTVLTFNCIAYGSFKLRCNWLLV